MATSTQMKGGLSPELIASLMANSRTRNAYGPKVAEFADSDEAAINPAEVWVEFKDKNASTLYQGFNNAIKKAGLENTILVKRNEDAVFLMHTERVRLVMEELAANGSK